jgi:hypothetical protein
LKFRTDRRKTRIAERLGSAAVAALVLALVIAVVSVGEVVGASNGSGAPAANKQLKKLKKQVASLQQQVAAQAGPRPPSGPAGGGLAGTYPSPTVNAAQLNLGTHTVTNISANSSDSGKGALTQCPGAEQMIGATARLGGNAVNGGYPGQLTSAAITEVSIDDSAETATAIATEVPPGTVSNWYVVVDGICANLSG